MERIVPATADQVRERRVRRVGTNYQSILLRYRPREAYPGRITLLFHADDFREGVFQGWEALAAGRLDIHELPGTHRTWFSEHVETTARCLKARLDDAQRAAGTAWDR